MTIITDSQGYQVVPLSDLSSEKFAYWRSYSDQISARFRAYQVSPRFRRDFVADERDYLSKAYQRFARCGSRLLFGKDADGLSLLEANFCDLRFCPLCSWRRRLQYQAKMKKRLESVDYLVGDHRWLFLTLTCPNVQLEDLNGAIKDLKRASRRLLGLDTGSGRGQARYLSFIRGGLSTLEVTRSYEILESGQEWVHPHLHLLLLADKDYSMESPLWLPHNQFLGNGFKFIPANALSKRRKKISHYSDFLLDNFNPGWLQLWHQALGELNYNPARSSQDKKFDYGLQGCYIKFCDQDPDRIRSSLWESLKYCTKPFTTGKGLDNLGNSQADFLRIADRVVPHSTAYYYSKFLLESYRLRFLSNFGRLRQLFKGLADEPLQENYSEKRSQLYQDTLTFSWKANGQIPLSDYFLIGENGNIIYKEPVNH